MREQLSILLTRDEMTEKVRQEHAYIPFETLEFWNKEQVQKMMDRWGGYGEFEGFKMIPMDEWNCVAREVGQNA